MNTTRIDYRPTTRGINVPGVRITTVALCVLVLVAGGLVAGGTAVADTGTANAQARPVAPDVATPGAYTALTPARVLDTRDGTGGYSTPFAQQSVRTLQVAGVGGVPSSGAGAVVLNVTVTNPTSGGYLTVYPGGTRPTSSNLNFVAGQTVANLVTVQVGPSGTVSIYFGGGTGSVDVVADVNGWYASGAAATDGAFTPLSPVRVLDTRTDGGRPNPQTSVTRQVAGVDGVPANAGSVVVNVTVTDPTGGGFLTVYPGPDRPTSSNLNFLAGRTVPNLVEVPLSSAGTISVFNGSTGTADVVLDVFGYFLGSTPSVDGMFAPLDPARILDSRIGLNNVRQPVPAGTSDQVRVTGVGGVPTTGVAAVVLNLTAVAGSGGGGFLTVYPGPGRPTASNLNFLAGQIVPNLVIAPVGAAGTILVYNGAGVPVDIVADVMGFVRDGALVVPDPSTSRYVDTLAATQAPASITATMSAAGRADARAATGNGPHLAVLEFGAQTNRAGGDGTGTGTQTGVLPPGASTRLTYAQVATAVKGYLDGFAANAAAGAALTVAVGTNSAGFDGSTYAPAAKGADWAALVGGLVTYGAAESPTITVVGADDIEPDFDASIDQVGAWITAFTTADTTLKLINNGAASACPTTLGVTAQSCGAVQIEGSDPVAYNTWKQSDYVAISRGLAPSQLSVLPQVYVTVQAAQWQNIDLTAIGQGSGRLIFAGVLTSVAACNGRGCTSLSPTEAWAAMKQALTAYTSTDSTVVPTVTDIRYP